MRVLMVLVVSSVFFAAGFGVADRFVRGRVWRGDQPLRDQAAYTPLQSIQPGQSPDSHVRFVDVATDVGIDFTYNDGAAGEYHLFETTGGGMAILDADGDGNQDLYLVNGCRVPLDSSDRTSASRYYRNGNERGMDDASLGSGAELVLYGQGACAGDYDNDGFADLYVTGFGRCVLLQNNGDGTFRDATEEAGAGSSRWCTSAAFADLDQDGALDLYVCTYAAYDAADPPQCERAGRRLHCLPSRFTPEPDFLLHNCGNGSFAHANQDTRIHDSTGRGLGLAVADFDQNGRPDIFVANDTSENFLFLQSDNFQFHESALSLGVALTGDGATMSGMGVACADYDQNGFADLFVTNFYQERAVLYQNLGGGGFVDRADATALGAASRDRLGFGAVFLDANLDGFPDLFVANGHISDMAPFGIPYRMRQQFFMNEAGRSFRDSSEPAGPYFHQKLLGRGTAAADMNNDGLPDVVVSHIADPASLLLNRTTQHGHWIGLQLIGTSSNRDGANATVIVAVDGIERRYELTAGGGYLSSSDRRLIVGLDSFAGPVPVTVRWPSGAEVRCGPLEIDRYHAVRESADR